MADLSTSYLGLKLKNPIVVSACPFSEKVETMHQVVNAGAAAIVLYSLFEEQINRQSRELDHFLNEGTESFAEALSYLPNMGRYSSGPDSYLSHLRYAKKEVKIPIIGSLNGVSSGGWIDYAQKIQDAGADALELNLYYLSTDMNVTSSQLEDAQVKLVADVRKKVKIPIAVKLSPFFTALPNVVKRMVEAGANGVVLFNRFYQPDFDLETLEVTPNLVLSAAHEIRMPLRWIAIMYGQIHTDFALTSGVHSASDAIKAVMAGASVAMIASVILKHGPEKITKILNDMQEWCKDHQYDTLKQMQGSMSQKAVNDPSAFERANYMKVLSSYALRY